MSTLLLDPPTERIAVNLLRHLEWQAEGFSLIFLFADVGPSFQLAAWLDERLSGDGRPLQQYEVKDDFVREPEIAVDRFVAEFAAMSARPGGIWYGMQRHPGDARWNRARTLFLARLNERRFLLERDLKRPLVLVLPAHFRPEARTIAPDIWHRRHLSEELRVATAGAGGAETSALAESTLNLIEAGDRSLPAYDEWQRMQSAVPTTQIYLPTAWRACNDLLTAGRPADADAVAQQALTIARERAPKANEAGALRDLSVSLDNVGQVARMQGDWAQAESVYRESLSLSRQLVERLGGTPEALDDVADGLLNIARLPSGDNAAKAEAVAIYQALAARYPTVRRYSEQLEAAAQGDSGPSAQSESQST